MEIIKANVYLPTKIIKSLIFTNYGLATYSIEKVRAVFKVTTPNGIFGFKGAEELTDLQLVAEYLEKIRKNGFTRMPHVIPTKDQEYLLFFNDKGYFLEEWLDLKEIPQADSAFFGEIGKSLAEFHKAGQGIHVDKTSSRYKWAKRKKQIRKTLDRLILINENIVDYAYSSEDMNMLNFLVKRCKFSYDLINNIDYNHLLRYVPESATFCHGGLQHRNIMLDHNGEIWFIDFETLTYAERVKDIAHYLEVHMKQYSWDINVVKTFIDAYQSRLVRPIQNEEWKILLSYLACPSKLSRFIRYFEENRLVPNREKIKKVLEEESLKEPVLHYLNNN